MSTLHRFGGLFLAGVMGLAATMATGCSEPVATTEARGSTSSKLLAPKPTLKLAASSKTKATYGIAEWRLFRGKHSVFVSGYDAHGKAVKGISAGIANNENGEATLTTSVNDGSKYKSQHSFVSHKSHASTKIPAASAAFVKQTFSDLNKLHIGLLNQSAAAPKTHAGKAATCNADMTSVVLAALQCIQANGGNSALASQCVAAAQAAQGAGTCSSTSTSTGSATSSSSSASSTTADDGDIFDDDIDDIDDDGDVFDDGGDFDDDIDDDDDDFDDGDFDVDGDDPFGDGDCPSCDGGDDIDGDFDDGEVFGSDDIGGGDTGFASFKNPTLVK